MKNKKAKLLMINSIRSNNMGEFSIVNKVSIKTSDLKNGSVLIYSTYIGGFDASPVMSACLDFAIKLAIPKKTLKLKFPYSAASL